MSDFKPQARAKTVLDDPKLKLYADKLPGAKGRPSLLFYYTNNNPRIDVYTQVPNDGPEGKGLIRAKIDILQWALITEIIEKLAAGERPEKPYVIKNMKPFFDRQNNKPGEPVLETKTMLGVDKEGRIYMSILDANAERPKIQFFFGFGMYHTLFRGNDRMPDDEVSRLAAKSWAVSIRSLMPHLAMELYVHKTQEDRQGGGGNRGGGGGGYNNGGNRGGYNNNSGGGGGDSGGSKGEFDDDLPF